MQISHTCQSGPGLRADGEANEDFVLTAERFVLVLDGATDSGLPNGCVHDVAWLASRLAGRLAEVLIDRPALPLREVLREGISRTRALHPGCDLTNPNSPASTVAIVREYGGALDCLVLADSPVVVETTDGQLFEISDDAVEHLPAYDRESVSRLRNAEGGFWVASTVPEAADHAVVHSLPVAEVRRFLAATDGVSRLVERYGWGWPAVLDLCEKQGPAAVVRAVREAELADPPGRYRGKLHDDATVAFGLPHEPDRLRPPQH